MKKSLIPGVAVLLAFDAEQERAANGEFGSGTAKTETDKMKATLEPKTAEQHRAYEKHHRQKAEEARKVLNNSAKVKEHEERAAHHKAEAAKLG